MTRIKKRVNSFKGHRTTTVYDSLRQKLGIDRLSIDDSYTGITEQPVIRKVYNPPSYEIINGFEVSTNRDPTQFKMKHVTSSLAPRGWCRKYWWDVEKPIAWIELGGRITDYTDKHKKLLNKVHEVLQPSLTDEGNIKQELLNDYKFDTASIQLQFKHQIFRDVAICPLGRPYLFSHDDPQFPPTEYSNMPQTESTEISKLLPSYARHRLLDSRLNDELLLQQKLRDSCVASKTKIEETLTQWEEIEGIWIRRTDGVPLSHI